MSLKNWHIRVISAILVVGLPIVIFMAICMTFWALFFGKKSF